MSQASHTFIPILQQLKLRLRVTNSCHQGTSSASSLQHFSIKPEAKWAEMEQALCCPPPRSTVALSAAVIKHIL